MKRFLFSPRRIAVVAASLAVAGSSATAQSPAPKPLMLTAPVTALAENRGVEVYHGTTKVSPIPQPPASPAPVVAPKVEEPAKPRVESPIYIPIVAAPAQGHGTPPAFGGIVPAKAEFSAPPNSIVTFASALLNRFFPNQPKPLLLSNAGLSSSIPNVVVIREPATESKVATAPQVIVVCEPMPELKPAALPEATGFRLTPELIVAGCVSGFCLLVTMFLAGRGTSRPALAFAGVPTITPPGPPAPPHDPERDGPILMGKYRAGPLPQTAEAFDVGPTYHEEQETKKKVEEANAAAVVTHLLTQNLGLADELAAEFASDEPAVVEAVAEDVSPPMPELPALEEVSTIAPIRV